MSWIVAKTAFFTLWVWTLTQCCLCSMFFNTAQSVMGYWPAKGLVIALLAYILAALVGPDILKQLAEYRPSRNKQSATLKFQFAGDF